MANGEAYDQLEKADLYAIIGDSFGSAPAGKFKVPDMRGMFMRGVDPSGANDPGPRTLNGVAVGNVVGSIEVDALQNIYGSWDYLTNTGFSVNPTGAYTQAATGSNGQAGVTPLGSSNRITFNAANVARTSSETRPKNIGVNYIIKY